MCKLDVLASNTHQTALEIGRRWKLREIIICFPHSQRISVSDLILWSPLVCLRVDVCLCVPIRQARSNSVHIGPHSSKIVISPRAAAELVQADLDSFAWSSAWAWPAFCLLVHFARKIVKAAFDFLAKW